MDANKLRDTYDQYFSKGLNQWTSTDKKKTLKVAHSTFNWLKKLGFTKVSPTLLDVGCAVGYYTEAFRLMGAETTGLDYSSVAIKQARKNFPECHFVEMNGFEPDFNKQFDIIFCRGFSGANTHDLDFISMWINKYMMFVSPGGYFVFAYSSNFSGTENQGEIVNHSQDELKKLVSKINGIYKGMFLFYYFGFFSKLKRKIEKIFNPGTKDYFYIFIQKPSDEGLNS